MKKILTFSVIGGLLGLTLAVCPAGYVTFKDPSGGTDNCILFATDMKRDFFEGWDHCKAMKGDLAYLDKGDIHYQVRNYILARWPNEGFHIGGNDEMLEGNWLWVKPNKAMQMGPPHWLPGQPDGGRNENFACLYTPDFYYNSCANYQKMFTLCMYFKKH